MLCHWPKDSRGFILVRTRQLCQTRFSDVSQDECKWFFMPYDLFSWNRHNISSKIINDHSNTFLMALWRCSLCARWLLLVTPDSFFFLLLPPSPCCLLPRWELTACLPLLEAGCSSPLVRAGCLSPLQGAACLSPLSPGGPAPHHLLPLSYPHFP